jgi:hypothetical protein
MSNEKKIDIQGINNRYQVKKLIGKPQISQNRKVTQKWNISRDWLEIGKQEELIQDIYSNYKENNISTHSEEASRREIVLNEINKKISSYKQQDVIRKLTNTVKFIDTDFVITLLFDSKLCCYYCKEFVYLLYEKSREMNQWSLDRINNDEGHNKDNVIVACLECNLQRRNRGKDAFLFTKQLNIVKSDT